MIAAACLRVDGDRGVERLVLGAPEHQPVGENIELRAGDRLERRRVLARFDDVVLYEKPRGVVGEQGGRIVAELRVQQLHLA